MTTGTRLVRLLCALAFAAIPVVLIANSSGPPIRMTGAAVDGGLDCSLCHGITNSDTRGSVTIQAVNYNPGVRQIVRVTVYHPQARRWGFQLTAQPVNDLTKMAGSFTPTENIRVRCDPDGRDSPCTGALEFASQTSLSSYLGTDGKATFDVEWMPPINEVGDIMLHAAGDAAEVTGGDRIYTTSIRLASQGACNLTQRPTVRTALNAASFQPGLAANSMFSVFGMGFAVPGRSRLVGPGDLADNRFPKELACIAVEIEGQRAPITYVQTDQINAQVPAMTATGPARLQVILNPGRQNELRSDMATIPMQLYTPAFFTFNGTSIAAQFAGSAEPVANSAVVAGGRPARPGDVVTLYGTGFGASQPFYQAGEIPPGAARLRDPFTITIGGITLGPSDILYAGLSPTSISGLYQFNVRIPAATPEGDLPVVIDIGGLRTQDGTTIPVRR